MAKTFYDDAETLVLEGLEGVALLNPKVSLDKAKKVVWLTSPEQQRVALLSGGGAGHEPAHAGYVGDGMLTAAVSGSVFASPSVVQIVSGIQRIATPAGVLLIIKNYTGDVFHFSLAAEKAKVLFGIPVEVLVVGDDVSVGRKKGGKVGRRGLAGTVLVHKILGSFTREKGATLADTVKLGRAVAENLATVGASLEHVHIPGREVTSKPPQNQVELGMGIHNEPGCQTLQPRPALPVLVGQMLDQLLSREDKDRAFVDFSDAQDIVLMVNNLGGVSPLELGGITTTVIKALDDRGIKPKRVLSGTYMTSFNGLGFSITLLKATPAMVGYLDAETDAIGWTKALTPSHSDVYLKESVKSAAAEQTTTDQSPSGVTFDPSTFSRAVLAACEKVVNAEQVITEHDSIVGDGDCGITLARGAKAVAEHLKGAGRGDDAVREMAALTDVVEDTMDGTSGAIYSIFLAAFASELSRANKGALDTTGWIQAAVGALTKLQAATPARVGDRTLMDALIPFIETLVESKKLDTAVSAARAGVEATKGMKASLGRAVYVEDSAWELVPDPGAEGVLCILEGLQTALS